MEPLSETTIKEEPVTFKAIRKRNLRQRKASDSDEDDASRKSDTEDSTEVS